MKKRIVAIALAALLCLAPAALSLAAAGSVNLKGPTLDIFAPGVDSIWLKEYLSASDYALLMRGARVAYEGTDGIVSVDLAKGILYVDGTGSCKILVYDANGKLIFCFWVDVHGGSALSVSVSNDDDHKCKQKHKHGDKCDDKKGDRKDDRKDDKRDDKKDDKRDDKKDDKRDDKKDDKRDDKKDDKRDDKKDDKKGGGRK